MENKRVEPKTIAGFMELLPNEQILFNQMIDTIRKSYESFGFLPIDSEGANMLFQLINKRYENHPTIITTNTRIIRSLTCKSRWRNRKTNI